MRGPTKVPQVDRARNLSMCVWQELGLAPELALRKWAGSPAPSTEGDSCQAGL